LFTPFIVLCPNCSPRNRAPLVPRRSLWLTSATVADCDCLRTHSLTRPPPLAAMLQRVTRVARQRVTLQTATPTLVSPHTLHAAASRLFAVCAAHHCARLAPHSHHVRIDACMTWLLLLAPSAPAVLHPSSAARLLAGRRTGGRQRRLCRRHRAARRGRAARAVEQRRAHLRW
jgi:hypothetical protein